VIRLWAVGVGLLGVLGVGDFLRETNSHAAASRGASAYEAKQYADSVRSFKKAQELAPSSRGAFNLGTAEIAAGQREQGSAQLTEAIGDPELRADALYNRGNSALAAKALDHAVRDYIDALKANPNHAAAKRNLEIALIRRKDQQQQQQAGGGGKQNQKGQSPQPPKQQQPSAQGQQQKPQPGQVDMEALLRSVQQQEQEELRRMKGRAAEGPVGW
jgi:Ca-activated chloride channel family protein